MISTDGKVRDTATVERTSKIFIGALNVTRNAVKAGRGMGRTDLYDGKNSGSADEKHVLLLNERAL